MFYDSGQTQDDGSIESYEEESQTFGQWASASQRWL